MPSNNTQLTGVVSLCVDGVFTAERSRHAPPQSPHDRTEHTSIDTRAYFLYSNTRLILTIMSANVQRDGRPAEYRWRPLFNAAKFR